MKLATEFVQLPYRFDAERLAREVAQFADSAWRPHPQGHKGNWSLPLVAVDGNPDSDATKGPMQPTPHLERCPYIQQVMASLGAPIGRSRLMLIEGNEEAVAHVDTNYYWAQRVRVHIPVITTPSVEFICGTHKVHLKPGEAWIFDNWRLHNVLNRNPARRIHLVIDTVGSPTFWRDVERGSWPFSGRSQPESKPELIPFDESDSPVQPAFESQNFPIVMSPWEQQALIPMLWDGLAHAERPAQVERLRTEVESFMGEWKSVWSLHGDREPGWPAYRTLLDRLDGRVDDAADGLHLDNGCAAAEIVRQLLVRPALNTDLAGGSAGSVAASNDGGIRSARRPAPFVRPIFVVCPPRSGSSLLFETVAQSPSVWTIGGESHALIEGIPGLHPASRNWESNRLTAEEATPGIAGRLTTAFRNSVFDRDGNPPSPGASSLRLLEKTPKNALRMPFLASAFPDAMFVYLYRDPRETLSSMIDAWRSGRFVTYPDLPGWKGAPWSLLLVPGWRELIGKPLVKIVAHQWKTTVETLIDDLESLPPDRWCVASYDRLVSSPREEIERICQFVGIEFDRDLDVPLPNSRHTLTSPDPEKWRSNSTELAEIMPMVSEVAERAREIFAVPPERQPAAFRQPAATTASSSQSAAVERPSAFRSVSTPSFAELLRVGGFSAVLSTYQSGRLITLRADDKGLNTHLCSFPSPMGIAVGPRHVAFGTESHVWYYRNQPDVAPKVDASRRTDACFLPVRTHFTGDIRVHEMAWAGDELWIVNTRFSTLCTLDVNHSFVPRWRPRFISGLAAEDRCHLNGLCIIDGRVKYVTALGETDSPGGWRENKANGGILIDVESGEIVANGLSMPHSPRWYRDRLWILESGKGEFGYIDLATGRTETVIQLPGFTRGLTFAGPYALIGLSQVRESVFGGIPLTDRLQERVSGVWIVDTRNGQVAGMLRFQDLVQEIFDIQLLPGLRYPELVEPGSEWVKGSFVLPDEAIRNTVPEAIQ